MLEHQLPDLIAKSTISKFSREEKASQTFGAICSSVVNLNHFNDDHDLIVSGDCNDVLKLIPDESINLILTDPPYHSTKKSNITGDTDFETDEKYLHWVEGLLLEWRRILKPNGSIYFFCSPKLAGRLEVLFLKHFKVLASITWTKPNDPGFDGWKQKMNKESLRSWYSHTERIIFCEPAVEVNLKRSTLGLYLKTMRTKAGLSTNDLTEVVGAYGRVNHGGAVCNWEAGRNVPSKDQYEKITKALLETGKVSASEVLDYDEVVRPFNPDINLGFTDVWDFQNVRPYRGKHPAEKPQDMLRHIINTSSMEGDLVLDCFGGSGSTALAAKSLNRRSVTIEIEPKWFDYSKDRLKFAKRNSTIKTPNLVKNNKLQLNLIDSNLP